MIRPRREKVFGPGRAVPLDRNAKARIMAYAKAWGARHRQPRQHRGPITRAFLEVLEALLWGFHNSRTAAASRPMRPSPPRPSVGRHPGVARSISGGDRMSSEAAANLLWGSCER